MRILPVSAPIEPENVMSKPMTAIPKTHTTFENNHDSTTTVLHEAKQHRRLVREPTTTSNALSSRTPPAIGPSHLGRAVSASELATASMTPTTWRQEAHNDSSSERSPVPNPLSGRCVAYGPPASAAPAWVPRTPPIETLVAVLPCF